MTVVPRMSVVVPCFNAARWIDATLDSVQRQSLAPFETIVVDDGSHDGSADIVRRLHPDVRVIEQANAGVAAARNRGLSEARGDWVAFVDADDIWLPGKLAAQWQAVQAQPLTRLVYSAWHVWHCTDPWPDTELLAALDAVPAGDPRWRGVSGWIYPELLIDSHVWTSTVIAERALLNALGGFDESLRIGEDLDLWLRASRVTPIAHVARPLALYRMHPASLTKGAPDENHQARVVGAALCRWGLNSPDGRRADRAAIDRALAVSWRGFSGAHLSHGDPQRAREGAWRSLCLDWRSLHGWRLLLRATAAAARRGARAAQPRRSSTPP